MLASRRLAWNHKSLAQELARADRRDRSSGVEHGQQRVRHDQARALCYPPECKAHKELHHRRQNRHCGLRSPHKMSCTIVIKEDCATTPPSARQNPNIISITTAPARNATNGVAMWPTASPAHAAT